MKVVFPVTMKVKRGGSDNILKLYFGKTHRFLSSYCPERIILHFGTKSISGATPEQLKTYHSINCQEISHFLHNENYTINSELIFFAIEDNNGLMHLVFVENHMRQQQ